MLQRSITQQMVVVRLLRNSMSLASAQVEHGAVISLTVHRSVVVEKCVQCHMRCTLKWLLVLLLYAFSK